MVLRHFTRRKIRSHPRIRCTAYSAATCTTLRKMVSASVERALLDAVFDVVMRELGLEKGDCNVSISFIGSIDSDDAE
jgi:hypothetical protein